MKAQAPSCRQPSADRLSTARRGIRLYTTALVTLFASVCVALAIAGEPQRGKNQPGQHPSKHHSQKQSQQLPSKHSSLSAQQAVSIAKQRQQGKVLSVKRSNGSYKVKMLHQGQVRYITVAAD